MLSEGRRIPPGREGVQVKSGVLAYWTQPGGAEPRRVSSPGPGHLVGSLSVLSP